MSALKHAAIRSQILLPRSRIHYLIHHSIIVSTTTLLLILMFACSMTMVLVFQFHFISSVHSDQLGAMLIGEENNLIKIANENMKFAHGWK